MLSRRSAAPRAVLILLAMAWATVTLASPIAAANATVTGRITFTAKVALSDAAVAVITLIDQSPSADAGAIIGQQRIDTPGAVPIDFSVLYDAAAIDATHPYALFASIIDGTSVWQNATAVPVITGGPTSGVDVVLPALPSGLPQVTGTIRVEGGGVLTTGAVAIAALIKQETGTLVSRDVRPAAGTQPAFSISVDPGLLDPAATYVVKAAIVDGAAVWENRQGVAGIAGGQPVADLTVPVTRVGTDLPIEVAPTPPPTEAPTDEPTEAPTDEPTEAPTGEPTAAPTEAPTAAPTAIPTAEPTATPTATPSPSPTPSLTPSASATAAPITSPVTVTLSYAEPQELSAEAFAVVAIVRGTVLPDVAAIVASERYQDIGQQPIELELTFDPAAIDPSETYTVQAAIVDGANSWITGRGVPVLTGGAGSEVDVPLTYRPDLVKAAVTGQITAVGLQPAPDAYAIAILVEMETGISLGIDVFETEGRLPVPFAVPYQLTDIDPTVDYVIRAEVGDESGTTWQNPVGVPVITKDNPTSEVTVVVTEIVQPTPSPSGTPAPTASPAPEPTTDGSGGMTPLVAIIVIGSVVAVAGALIAKLRNG